VVTVSIDPATGYLATTDCSERREEFYLPGTEPTEHCPQHGGDAAKPMPSVLLVPGADGQRPDPGAGEEQKANPPFEGTGPAQ
jgi:hypothetical protein